jgi:hypothetical protein
MRGVLARWLQQIPTRSSREAGWRLRKPLGPHVLPLVVTCAACTPFCSRSIPSSPAPPFVSLLLQGVSQTQNTLDRLCCHWLSPVPPALPSAHAPCLPPSPAPSWYMPVCPSCLLQGVSQTQNPLELPPEVESLRFHEPRAAQQQQQQQEQPLQPAAAAAGSGGGGARSGGNGTSSNGGSGGGGRPWSAGGAAPDVCESFAFQRDAVEFAVWCNSVGPGVVAALQVGGWLCPFVPLSLSSLVPTHPSKQNNNTCTCAPCLSPVSQH